MTSLILAVDLDHTAFSHPGGTLARLMPSQASRMGGALWRGMKRTGLDGAAMRSAQVIPEARSALCLARALGYRIHLVTARDDTTRVRAITERTLLGPVLTPWDRLELRPKGLDPVSHKADWYASATLVLDDDVDLLCRVREKLRNAGQKCLPPMMVISSPECWGFVPDLLGILARARERVTA